MKTAVAPQPNRAAVLAAIAEPFADTFDRPSNFAPRAWDMATEAIKDFAAKAINSKHFSLLVSGFPERLAAEGRTDLAEIFVTANLIVTLRTAGITK